MTQESRISFIALQLENFIPYRLNVLASLVSQNLSSIYSRRFRLGIPEWRVIATLGQFGTITAKVIGEHSHMQKAKVSRAVAVLTKRRLIDRTPNHQDLREAYLTLSPKGRELYETLLPDVLKYEKMLLSTLSNEEALALDLALKKLTAAALEQRALASRRAASDKAADRIDA